MADANNLPVNSGENILDSIRNKISQGSTLEQALAGVDLKELYTFFDEQYSLLKDKYDSLSEQISSIANSLKRNDTEMVQRIERIMNLMTSNMSFIKQIIQIEEANNDKLAEQEKINMKQELQFSSLVEKQNRFSQSLKNMDTNTRAILQEIEVLKANDVSHDKFRYKIITIASVVTGIVVWLLTGDNLAKLVILVDQFGSK